MTQSEELPRIFQLHATCCPVRIIRFDLPSHAMTKLAERALNLGWTYHGDGTWTCDTHSRKEQQ